MKIMTVIGTRPEGIKMAPVIKLLAQDPALKSVVVTTSQHREMLQTVFEVFDFKPDYDLKIMAPNQTLTQITSRVLLGMERVLQQEKPAQELADELLQLALEKGGRDNIAIAIITD